MATTKIHAIKSTLKKALDYIQNPDKTQGGLLVSGFNVAPETAYIDFEITANFVKSVAGDYSKSKKESLAYHMIQSFSPSDRISPEQAHELGIKWAKEVLGENHDFVIATHVDKGHIHNHVIFNSYSQQTLKKFRSQPYKTAAQLRAISDRICSENDLSVIKDAKQMGCSYKEYHARKRNTSWKSEIRKKLSFILETATNYEDFKAAASELGVVVVDSGKHIKYKLEEQERFVRGEKLSDTDTFTQAGIESQLKQNQSAQNALKQAISLSLPKAKDFKGLLQLLQEEYGITARTSKTNGLVYTLNDVNTTRVKASALGSVFSATAIEYAIASGTSLADLNSPKERIADAFQKKTHTKVEERDTPVLLTKKQISKITVDGILVELPVEEGRTSKIFIDNRHVDFSETGDRFTAYLGSKYDYYLVTDDTTQAATSRKYVKGEQLIRQMELLNHVPPTVINIPARNVKAISEKGVMLTIPEYGIDSVFIEKQYASYSATAGCCVQLYENWNYSFRGKNTDNQLQNIVGADLISRISPKPEIDDGSLTRRIIAAERKATLRNTKEIAAALLLSREEKLESFTEFAAKIADLQKQVSAKNEAINAVAEKIEGYKTAGKYLAMYQKHALLGQQRESLSGFKFKKFVSAHKDELKMFDFAQQALENLGVNPEVNVEKVNELVKQYQKQMVQMQADLKAVNEQVVELKKAEDIFKSVSHQNCKTEEYTK